MAATPSAGRESNSPQPTRRISCAILVGGESPALLGQKCLLRVGKAGILDRILTQVKPLFNDLVLIGNQPEPYKHFNLPVMPDLFTEGGPLAGIHSALRAAHEQRCLVLAGDLPFITRDLVLYLAAQPTAKALVPRPPKGPQPLCAIYDKSLTALAERRLLRKQFDVEGFALAAAPVLLDLTGFAEPTLLDYLFFDVDSPADLELARKLVSRMKPSPSPGQQQPE